MYISFGKAYRLVNDALLDLLEQVKEQISIHEKVFKKLTRKIIEYINDISRLGVNVATLGLELERTTSRNPPLAVFQKILVDFINDVSDSQRKAVVVIDELQNFLQFSEWDPWGLMKFFMSLQEQYGGIQFVFITSDYRFRNRVLSRVPVEYIDTFYLGEMTFDDSLELLSFLLSKEVGKEVESVMKKGILDIVGGNPALIYRVVDYSVRYGLSLDRSVAYLLGHVVEEVERKIILFRKEKELSKSIGDKWGSLKELFRRICREPVRIEDIDLDVLEYIDWFVGWNIIQYGCSDYVGIYEWNKDKSGGLCSLDVIAPSNRLYLNAFKKIFREKQLLIEVKMLLHTYRLLIGRIMIICYLGCHYFY